ncbi:hypothetical protein Tco_0449660 [Tanacetum coccineum]
MAEVQLTAAQNVLANEQQHSDQSEPIYDIHLLEKVDSNTTPDSTNMSHRGGEIDQDAEHPLVNAELIKTKDMVEKEFVENADLKAQIQEKVFANAALKNKLRKLKGNSMDTKFAKASILGKLPSQPSRNHLVVRQPNAYTSERPRISKPRFASKVDEKNDLSKTVTPHYLPKVRESAPAKPHHVNAPSSSRNSQKESYGSNDMAHTYFLEEGRKKTQERNMIPIPRDMASARTHHTPNACTPNPRNISRCLHVSKSSCVPSNVVPLVDHSRNFSFFSDSKHFVCSTCQKCVFNENHDDCITKLLKEVNSRAKVQSHKTRNNNKPVEPKSHTQKPGRQIVIGQMFYLLSLPLCMRNHTLLDLVLADTMAEENVPAPVPTTSEEHILPFNSWLLIGKGNLFLDLQKLKKNPIFRISVDILQNTNFFRELTSSANVPNIYIQQLWNALTQEAKTGIYKFQLDEQWFTLNADLLR